MRSLTYYIKSICCFVCISATFQGLAQQLHFSSIDGLIEQEIGRLVLPQIYAKLNIDITITPLPAKRAQFEADSGISDGEIMRIHSYGKEAKNVIRVPTAYFYLETSAFALKSRHFQIQSLEDLKGHHIAIVRGVKHAENAVKDILRVTELNSTDQILQFVARGRADLALANTSDGKMNLNTLGLNDLAKAGPALQTLDLYHYIHKDHAQLVSAVDRIIRNAKDSGELQSMIELAISAVYRIDEESTYPGLNLH